ncbi:hypothetical protein PHLGIDRAFT_194192 [Phlebiopsis gigantea 11061_1 CR5-6]|uniref:Uncharacterized protein n=1 Tax=Phlebiopsis gigantea (strain 11061_1 CR5-6) TaxID=745531 RepID=A0A0C3S3J9_PHLG1|nr:hypothetical protein PHLGIDRAFT_194192 [Phlebiopsis gigantea 11061_1 CR5-6]
MTARRRLEVAGKLRKWLVDLLHLHPKDSLHTSRNQPGTRYDIIFGRIRKPLAEDEWPSKFPIQQMPPEILAEVFYWYIKSIHEHPSDYDPDTPTPYCWLVLRHVCHTWRSVALNDPKLSAFICLTRLDCVQEMIERSKDLPIHVFDIGGGRRPPSDEASAALRLIMTHFSRVVTATFETWYDDDPDSSMIPSSSSLSTTSALRSLTWNGHHITSNTRIFPDLAYPHLIYLRCSGVSLGSICNMLTPNIRYLELQQPPSFALTDLLAALASMQDLGTLILRFLSSDTAPSLQQPIALPRLQKLSINSLEPALGILIFRHIVYPATASVELLFHSEVFERDGPLLPEVQRRLDGTRILGPLPELQSIEILSTWDEIWIRLWTQPRPMEDTGDWDNRRTSDRSPDTHLVILSRTRQDWVSNFLQYLPLSNIHTAYLVERSVDFEPLDLWRIIASMPSLDELFVSYEVYDDVHPMDIPQRLPTPTTPERLETSFPQLGALHIHEHHQHRLTLGQLVVTSDLRHVAERLAALHARGHPRFSALRVARERFSDPDSMFLPDCTCEFCVEHRHRPSQTQSMTETCRNIMPHSLKRARRFLACGLI